MNKDQSICRICGTPITKKRATDALCKSKACQAKNAARRVSECKARRAARRARAKALKNRVHHLPARIQLKLICIALLAKQHAETQAKLRHSQEPLPAEVGAVDTLDAVRRLSEAAGRG